MPSSGWEAPTTVWSSADLRAERSATGRVVGGRYRLLRTLARGGGGEVYLAEHLVLGNRVALKLLDENAAHQSDLVTRFMCEARAAASIDHEGIVRVLDLGETAGGVPYFVMELLAGRSLADVLRTEGRLPFARFQRIALSLCGALAAAHAQGIVHRDLKPSNIMLVRNGDGEETVKLVDFGVAKVPPRSGWDVPVTSVGVTIGTPSYLAPEQASGGRCDPRTDVYGFGGVMYEMLTGEAPYAGHSVVEMLAMQLAVSPAPPTERAPKALIPRELDAIVMRALAKDPNERYASMDELASDLHALTFTSPTIDPAGSALRRTRPWWPLWLVAVVALAAAVVVGHEAGARSSLWRAATVASP